MKTTKSNKPRQTAAPAPSKDALLSYTATFDVPALKAAGTIRWSKLFENHQVEVAQSFPAYLKAVAAPDQAWSHWAAQIVADHLEVQDAIAEATPVAVPLLVQLLGAKLPPHAFGAVVFILTQIMGAVIYPAVEGDEFIEATRKAFVAHAAALARAAKSAPDAKRATAMRELLEDVAEIRADETAAEAKTVTKAKAKPKLKVKATAAAKTKTAAKPAAVVTPSIDESAAARMRELLALWRKEPSTALATYIRGVSETTRMTIRGLDGTSAEADSLWNKLARRGEPTVIPALLATLASTTWQRASERLSLMARWMPDPRVDAAIVAMFERPPFHAPASLKPFWDRLCRIGLKILDPAQFPRLKDSWNLFQKAEVPWPMSERIGERLTSLQLGLRPILAKIPGITPAAEQLGATRAGAGVVLPSGFNVWQAV